VSNILKHNGAIRLAQLAADPAGAENGVIYYNTVSNVVRQYVNGGFQDVPDQALTLVGLALNDGHIIIGDGSNLSVSVDSASVGDIDADSSAGLTIKSNVIVNADINSAAAIALSKLATLTASRALQSDGSGVISASSVTSSELAFVSGVTSAIQTQLGNKISSSEKGANNGVATLDGGGKVPASQLPNTVMELQGFWNANTNSPTLADGTGNPGDIYEVDTAGSTDFGNGAISFAIGDWAVYAADAKWHKSINSNTVSSVNGQTGVVVLDTDDITEGAALYFTAERAQDAVGGILTDTSSIDFTYNDAGDAISAVVLPAGVDHNSLLNFVANKHIDHSGVSIATAADSGLTGGGNITATRNLSVDINGTTAEATADNADTILIYDDSATALKKMTRANFLSGITLSSSGDISETSFTGLVNNTANQTVTGLSFANGVVRSFKAQVSIAVSATADSFANFELQGIQRGADWQMSEVFVGDSITGLSFSITNAGQVRLSIGNITGFSSAAIKFRALVTGV
jgi:hypothetical protein